VIQRPSTYMAGALQVHVRSDSIISSFYLTRALYRAIKGDELRAWTRIKPDHFHCNHLHILGIPQPLHNDKFKPVYN